MIGSPTPFGSDTKPIQLWNTAPRPPLYTASANILLRTETIDAVETKVGIRSALFDAQHGFVLNGVPVKIKGVSNHIGFGGVGAAIPDRVAEFQVRPTAQPCNRIARCRAVASFRMQGPHQ